MFKHFGCCVLGAAGVLPQMVIDGNVDLVRLLKRDVLEQRYPEVLLATGCRRCRRTCLYTRLDTCLYHMPIPYTHFYS